ACQTASTACRRSWGRPLASWWLFFFQAEDGIRYFHVTGVQTCALPISPCCRPFDFLILDARDEHLAEARRLRQHGAGTPILALRSEERRVGREWRGRWAGLHVRLVAGAALREARGPARYRWSRPAMGAS